MVSNQQCGALAVSGTGDAGWGKAPTWGKAPDQEERRSTGCGRMPERSLQGRPLGLQLAKPCAAREERAPRRLTVLLP